MLSWWCSLVFLLVGLDGNVREIGNIFVSLHSHCLQTGHDLVDKDVVIEFFNMQLDDASDAELDIRDAIIASFDKSRHDHLADVLSGENGHDRGQSLEGAHAVVIALLVNVVALYYLGNQVHSHPFLSERGGELASHGDTHASD